MELENFEQYKKEVLEKTADLMKLSSNQCNYEYSNFIEYYIQVIDAMSLDLEIKEKLKDYFVYQHLFLKS